MLLDVVKRQASFEALPDSQREEFAASIGARTKRPVAEFADWEAFETWYNSLTGLEYTLDGAYVEGFVVEDARHRHVKIKLDFYSFWKQLRSALDALKAGRQPKIKQECTYPELAQEVIGFMTSLPGDEIAKDTIIDIRRKYFAQQKQKS